MIDENLTSELEEKIRKVRILMVSEAEKSGFSHPKTVRYSQRLDLLLNQYQYETRSPFIKY